MNSPLNKMVLGLFFSFPSFLPITRPTWELRTGEFRFSVTDPQASHAMGQRCGVYSGEKRFSPQPLTGTAAFLPAWGAFSSKKS